MTSGPETTLWPAPPHTIAKQRLYKRYIQAWLPILALGGFRRLLIVDGFAGPGRYSTGEDGSPVVALKAVLEHAQLRRILSQGTRVRFLFVESRKDRFEHLKKEIGRLSVPNGIEVDPRHDTFEAVWTTTTETLARVGDKLEPALLFVDPFGPTGFPMNLIRRSADYPGSEVLINFAYQPLNEWFISQPSKHSQIIELYGSDDWRKCLEVPAGFRREQSFVTTYQRALASAGWRGVAFQMVNLHNQSQYYLIYGTKHHLGMRAFKDAAWFVAPDSQFQYSDLRDPNQVGFLKDMNQTLAIEDLVKELRSEFKGRSVEKRVLEEFTDDHGTARLTHLTAALREIEASGGVVEVNLTDDKKRTARSFPEGCVIRFEG